MASRDRVMFIPRPVPSTLRFRLLSILSKAVKSFAMSSSFIPIPVSSTATFRMTVPTSVFLPSIFRVKEPFSVYFTALVRRFVMIWRTRTSSPESTEGRVGSISVLNSSFLSSARFLIMTIRSFMMEMVSYSTGTISIFPASILEKSRMSLIMFKRFMLAV